MEVTGGMQGSGMRKVGVWGMKWADVCGKGSGRERKWGAGERWEVREYESRVEGGGVD